MDISAANTTGDEHSLNNKTHFQEVFHRQTLHDSFPHHIHSMRLDSSVAGMLVPSRQFVGTRRPRSNIYQSRATKRACTKVHLRRCPHGSSVLLPLHIRHDLLHLLQSLIVLPQRADLAALMLNSALSAETFRTTDCLRHLIFILLLGQRKI
jgi:hypothetical protein